VNDETKAKVKALMDTIREERNNPRVWDIYEEKKLALSKLVGLDSPNPGDHPCEDYREGIDEIARRLGV